MNAMREFSKSLICGSFLALICLSPLHAQTAANPPSPGNATAANAAPTGQVPDEVMKKLSDLVHSGKYAEAQQLTVGLLLAYPDDQRLIKAKALLDKSLASSKTADPATSASATQLTGMDKVDYNALIELARQAQQTTDLAKQTNLLEQFMNRSKVFLQKHPDQMLLLWEFRALGALSLNDMFSGYDAGRKLLAMGAAESNDPNLQNVLSKLHLKGWLDKQKVENYSDYQWILGTWSLSWSQTDMQGHVLHTIRKNTKFSILDSVIDAYAISDDGVTNKYPYLKGIILDSGEIRWVDHHLTAFPWLPVQSCEVANDKKTMTFVMAIDPDTKIDPATNTQKVVSFTDTFIFHKNEQPH
jgi:hypothetical protein